MSQRDLEGFLGRLVTDSRMRRSFFQAPEQTLAGAPYVISAPAIAALLELGEAPLEAFAATIDASILRATAVELESLPSERIKL